jgi:hypothetical protein
MRTLIRNICKFRLQKLREIMSGYFVPKIEWSIDFALLTIRGTELPNDLPGNLAVLWRHIHMNICIIYSLQLYCSILGLGRLHKTFRFISVTRTRTVSSTPWAGDQLVARPLLTVPGDCDDGELGGMNGFDRGNRSTRRKPSPMPLCPPQIPLVRFGREHGPPRWEASK